MEYLRLVQNEKVEKKMSYSRFLGHDVYVFMNVGAFLECCMCILNDHQDERSFQAGNTQTMVDHLKKHEKAGHRIPPDIYDNLWADDKENFGG
jgi:hypothetical protein